MNTRLKQRLWYFFTRYSKWKFKNKYANYVRNLWNWQKPHILIKYKCSNPSCPESLVLFTLLLSFKVTSMPLFQLYSIVNPAPNDLTRKIHFVALNEMMLDGFFTHSCRRIQVEITYCRDCSVICLKTILNDLENVFKRELVGQPANYAAVVFKEHTTRNMSLARDENGEGIGSSRLERLYIYIYLHTKMARVYTQLCSKGLILQLAIPENPHDYTSKMDGDDDDNDNDDGRDWILLKSSWRIRRRQRRRISIV